MEDRIEMARAGMNVTVPMPMTRVTLSTKETAAVMRSQLKDAFPGVKFSVTKGRGTGSAWIRVTYQDGPPESDVQSLVSRFQSRQFNSSHDGYDRREAPWVVLPGQEEPVEVTYTCHGVNTDRTISDSLRRDADAYFSNDPDSSVRLLNVDGTVNDDAIDYSAGEWLTSPDGEKRYCRSSRDAFQLYADYVWRTR